MRRLPAFLLLLAAPLTAQTWRAMGPPGGDVRSLGADPRDARRLFLGTADGHIFGRVVEPGDAAGRAALRWELLGRAGERQDGVVAAILVDPRHAQRLFAAVWYLDPRAGGGVFRSEDGGRTWHAAGLAGQAVRALAQAPSHPDTLVAGTLDGVYRSQDAGRTWQRISPAGHEEIRNLDSLAIDPHDPQTIYAGTYHLPWKTSDGGATWQPIHEGMQDDSDVMSILVDRTNPQRIYASACSGIYRSDNAGLLWKKIQGIPFSARRTHVIHQHPRDSQTVYAGTTEGLWKTADGGATWRRVTPNDWVVNAVVVDADGWLVVGTERLGVLASDDAGANFRAANEGFYHRQIVSLALDPQRPGRLLAVLANAPEPVLATEDNGRQWAPLGRGLDTERLLRVYASPVGWWAALERGDLMRYDEAKRAWVQGGSISGTSPPASRGGRKKWAKDRRLREPQVNDMAFSRDAWYVATAEGLFASRDAGASWQPVPLGPVTLPVSSVRVSRDGRYLWTVSLYGMVFSRDAGHTWTWHDLPLPSGGAVRLDVADEHTLLAAARTGLYISRDAGRTWQLAAAGLPDAPLQDLAIVGDAYLAAMQTGGLFLSRDAGRTWTRIEGPLAAGNFPAVTARDAEQLIFAASSTEGLYAVELQKGVGVSGTGGTSPK